MSAFIAYIPYLIGAALLLVMLEAISEALQALHDKISSLTYFIIRPIPWYYEHGLEAMKKLFRISPPRRLTRWGGPVRLILMLLMAIAAAVMIAYHCRTNEEFLILGLLAATPPFYPVNLLAAAIEGTSLFTVKSMINSVLVSALTIAFFHRQKELPSKVAQVVYELVFLVFFTSLTPLIPAKVYLLPGAIFESLHYQYITAFLPRILAIPLGIACFWGLALVAYIICCLFALAVRELSANIAYSLLPFAITAMLVVPFLDKVMDGTSDTAQGIVLALATVALTVFTWRSRAENEDNPADNNPNYKPLLAKLAAWVKSKFAQRKANKV